MNIASIYANFFVFLYIYKVQKKGRAGWPKPSCEPLKRSILLSD